MKLCSNCQKQFDHSNHLCPFCLHKSTRLEGYEAFAPELAEQSSGFEPEYFAKLFELEAGNFWFRSRNSLILWALQRYFPDTNNFLEIGCGTGFVLSGIRKTLPQLTLAGSEVFIAGLSIAAQRLPGVELFQMDARRIPFRDEFDVIGAFDVLEHISEDEEVLSEMYKATRNQGGILLTVPQHPFLWSQVDDYARHVRRYKAQELRDKVRRAGFDVTRITSFVSFLLPLMAISRLKQRVCDDQFDPAAELTTSPLTNTILEKVLDCERALIRTGLSLPAGGSLLVVAHRR